MPLARRWVSATPQILAGVDPLLLSADTVWKTMYACCQKHHVFRNNCSAENKPHGRPNNLSRFLLPNDMEEIEAYTPAAQGSALASR